jgi:hypothetical protein
VVPRTLRAALGRRELPLWLCDEAGLPPGASVTSLDPVLADGGLEPIGHRLELYFCRLLDSNQAAVHHVRILDRPWPSGLDPAAVTWPKRTDRLLKHGIAADPARASALTYGALLALPHVGARAVFTFAQTAEQAVDDAYADAGLPPALAELAGRAAATPWADLVDGDDPRFADLLAAGSGVLTRGSPWVLPEVFERIARIEQTSLDTALREYVAALSGLDGLRLHALLARLGVDGMPPRSLPKAINGAQISLERLRQLQVGVLERVPPHPVYMPALEQAISHLGEAAPCTAREAADSLHARGLSSTRFHPSSVLAAARLCGLAADFAVEPTPRGEIVVTRPLSASAPALVRLVTQRVRRFGAASVAEVTRTASENGIDVSDEEVRLLLAHFADVDYLDDGWFRLAHSRWSRLHALTSAILVVASPLDLASVRAGVCRAYRRREAALVPPEAVMLGLLRGDDGFEIDARGRIRAASSLDPSRSLGKNDRIFVDVFHDAGTRVLDRASLRDACSARGMSRHAFAFATTYSAVLDPASRQVWHLRGTSVPSS